MSTAPPAVSPWQQRLQRVWAGRGPGAVALWPLALLFGGITRLRRAAHRHGWRKTETLPLPVVVVGNLIVGGAGKTPVVLAVVAALRRGGFTPGIVSRGYGRRDTTVLEVGRNTPVADSGDEPLLLHLRSAAPVVVGTDRVAAVRRLIAAHSAVDVIVSDDGLQHLRLPRAAQVLVFDERGQGNGWLLPAGPMREALPRALPARSIVVYNAAAPSTPLPGVCATRGLAGVVALAGWWRGEPATWVPLAALRGRPVLAAAGIAQPQRFFSMLEALGLQITPLPLPDHHDFTVLPWAAQTSEVIVTEKDAIKLRSDRVGNTRVWVAPLDFALGAAFDAALIALLPPPGTPDGNAPA